MERKDLTEIIKEILPLEEYESVRLKQNAEGSLMRHYFKKEITRYDYGRELLKDYNMVGSNKYAINTELNDILAYEKGGYHMRFFRDNSGIKVSFLEQTDRG